GIGREETRGPNRLKNREDSMSNQLPARSQVCTVPELSDLVGPYCFEELGEDQRRAFEIHLLECDSCWNQVSNLDPAIEVLRRGEHMQNAGFMRPVFAEMLNRVFGGHLSYALPICLVYAALFPLA